MAKPTIIDPKSAFLVPGIEDPYSELNKILDIIFGRGDVIECGVAGGLAMRPRVGTIQARPVYLNSRPYIQPGRPIETPMGRTLKPDIQLGYYFQGVQAPHFDAVGSQLTQLLGDILETQTQTEMVIDRIFKRPKVGIRRKGRKSKTKRCWIWGRRRNA